MKKKLLYTISAVALTVAAFSIGRSTTAQTVKAESNIDYDSACDLMENVIDWNTDGKELSIVLSDGTEVYTYRKADIDEYKGNRIISIVDTDNGKMAIKKNGKSYIIKE